MLRALIFLPFICLSTNAWAQDTLSASKPDTTDRAVLAYQHSLDSTKKCLTHKIDSLTSLKLPATKYQHEFDSISRVNPLKAVKQQQARLSAAEQKALSPITGAEQKVTSAEQKLNQKIASLRQDATSELPSSASTGLPSTLPGLPNASLPGTGLPNTTLPSISNPLSTNTLSNPLSNNPLSKDINNATSPIKNDEGIFESKEAALGKDASKVEGYGKDVSGVLKGDSASKARLKQKIAGDSTERKNIEQKLENKAKNTTELKSLSTENQTLDQYKKMASSADDPAAMEKMGMDQAKKQAVNHFAGKEQVLQNAMSEISKLKQKYHSINGLKNIPKRVPNEMKGKPLIDRLVPGFTFQVLSPGHRPTVDFNPLLGYRLTKKLTVGAGWNMRLNIHNFHVNSYEHYYGPRSFVDYKFKGGMSARLELEAMKTLIPPNQTFLFGDRRREWVSNSFAGIKKDYKLFKYLKGNAQILYNVNTLFDKHHINLYGDPVSARVGFEIPMKKGMLKSVKSTIKHASTTLSSPMQAKLNEAKSLSKLVPKSKSGTAQTAVDTTNTQKTSGSVIRNDTTTTSFQAANKNDTIQSDTVDKTQVTVAPTDKKPQWYKFRKRKAWRKRTESGS